jgi:hypothetical protein
MILENYLKAVPDPRRKQAQKYDIGSLLLFSIMAILTGATSYRKIESFIKIHRKRLNKLCNIQWKRAPAHTSIRYALKGLEVENMEIIFRAHAQLLQTQSSSNNSSISMDGKVLRGSFDHFNDRKAVQMLSAFATDSQLVLGHIWMTDEDGDKEHEIQAAQRLIQEIGLSEQLFTLDALHTQKNIRSRAK